MTLDANTLRNFMSTFVGYGDFNSDTWFVGMEEGGGHSLENIQMRIGAWSDRGGHILEDCAEYHQAIGAGALFKAPVRSAQRTWAWLVRAQLASEGKPHDISAAKVMQGERWLRHGSNTCMIELLPLPSPSVRKWLYSAFSDDPALKTRDEYRAAMLPSRITKIKNLIAKHEPCNVVFCSKMYDAHWREIAGADFIEQDGVRSVRVGSVNYISALHPTGRIKGKGAIIKYWETIGAVLKRPN
jgi:hypothetical protein